MNTLLLIAFAAAFLGLVLSSVLLQKVVTNKIKF